MKTRQFYINSVVKFSGREIWFSNFSLAYAFMGIVYTTEFFGIFGMINASLQVEGPLFDLTRQEAIENVMSIPAF